MNNDMPRDIYQAAYDRAAAELRSIQIEFERLSLRHKHVAKVIEVLKPQIHFDEHVAIAKLSLTSRRAGLTVATRLTVMEKHPQA